MCPDQSLGQMVEEAARKIDRYAFQPHDLLSEETKASRQANARHKAIAVLKIYARANGQSLLAEALAALTQFVDSLADVRRQMRDLLYGRQKRDLFQVLHTMRAMLQILDTIAIIFYRKTKRLDNDWKCRR